MKKLILSVSFVVLFLSMTIAQKNEGEVKWYTFEEAVELNKKEESRKLFIDVYTDWCKWCHEMERTTFKDPKIVEILNNDFYAVRFDAESQDTIQFQGYELINEKAGERKGYPHQLAIALLQGKMSYPSIAYMNEKNQLITAIPGYFNAERLEPVLKFIHEDAYTHTSLKDYVQSYTTDK